MSPPSPLVVVVSDSGIARGFAQVILRADGLEAQEAVTPEQVLASLGPPSATPRTDAALVIDAGLLGPDAPLRDAWGRLVRDHPELPVVCMRLEGDETAPAALSGYVRAHVNPMEPRELVRAVREALRPGTRPLRATARSRRRETRSAG